MWLNVTEDDIDGEFFIDIEGGSTQAINPATRYRQGQEMITSIVPMLAQMGYDTEPALRAAISYMGLNPEHLLIQKQAPAQPEMPAGQPGQGQMPPEMMAQLAGQEQPGMPVIGNQATTDLAAMGGAPVPGAVEGGPLL
jgi:hypothetical protein